MKIVTCIYSYGGFVVLQTVEEGLTFLDGTKRYQPVMRELPENFVEEGKARIERIFKPLLDERERKDDEDAEQP